MLEKKTNIKRKNVKYKANSNYYWTQKLRVPCNEVCLPVCQKRHKKTGEAGSSNFWHFDKMNLSLSYC